MSIFANVMFEPTTIAACIVLGLFSGWLAGKFTDEPSYGTMGDLILGVVGGLVGGLLWSFFKSGAEFWGVVVISIIGAWVLIIGGRTIVARERMTWRASGA